MADDDPEVDDDKATGTWPSRIKRYREEEPMATVLTQVKKLKLDPTIHDELKRYFMYLDVKKVDVRKIRGPQDLEYVLEIADELQSFKDRAAEVLLEYKGYKHTLDRFWYMVQQVLYLRPEVGNMKPVDMRAIVVGRTMPELEDALAEVNKIAEAAELLQKNLNQTYNILYLQADTVKQMMYHRNLTKAGNPPPTTPEKGRNDVDRS